MIYIYIVLFFQENIRDDKGRIEKDTNVPSKVDDSKKDILIKTIVEELNELMQNSTQNTKLSDSINEKISSLEENDLSSTNMKSVEPVCREKRKLKCRYCSCEFYDKTDLLMHASYHVQYPLTNNKSIKQNCTRNSDSIQESLDLEGKNKSFKCVYCSSNCAAFNDLDLHYKTYHSQLPNVLQVGDEFYLFLIDKVIYYKNLRNRQMLLL